MKKLFITGGTGLLGSAFLKNVPKNLFDITLGSRRQKKELAHYKWKFFDLDASDKELDLQGFDTVLHLASNTSDLKANSDITGIKQLIKAIQKGQIKHLIVISIVGVESLPVKYFKTKNKVELLIKEAVVNYSIIRSTQFFEFFEKEIQNKVKLPIAFIPNLKYQPIDVDIVANHLVEVCKSNATNSIVEIGGAEIIFFKQAIKTYQNITGNSSTIISIPNALLGKLKAALTTKHQVENSKTWKQYLEEKYL